MKTDSRQRPECMLENGLIVPYDFCTTTPDFKSDEYVYIGAGFVYRDSKGKRVYDSRNHHFYKRVG